MDLKEPLIKANRVYKYSISYQEITEESREYGEISDDGFIIENETDEIGNLLKLAVETYGIYYPVAFGWWESTNPVENKDYFEKGIETYYILHITNEDGTNITEKEYDFITFLLSDGNYNKDEFTEYAVGGIVAGALALGIGGLIAYYYFNKGKGRNYPTGRAWQKEHYNDNDDEDYEISPNERNIKHKARNRQFDNGGEVKSLEKSLENAEKNYRKAILSEQVGIISPTELNRAKNKVNSIRAKVNEWYASRPIGKRMANGGDVDNDEKYYIIFNESGSYNKIDAVLYKDDLSEKDAYKIANELNKSFPSPTDEDLYYVEKASDSRFNYGNINKRFLNSIDIQYKQNILRNIANHYGISIVDAEKEVTDVESELLEEYITDISLRRKVYSDRINRRYADGGGVNASVPINESKAEKWYYRLKESDRIHLSKKYPKNDNETNEDWFQKVWIESGKSIGIKRNKFDNGGGVDSKAEKLANTIRKDYQNGVVVQVNNDFGDSAYFSISAPFEYSLSKERAKEINKKYFNGEGTISGSGNEHYLNLHFDLDNFANGGGVGNVLLQVGDVVVIYPNYASIYTNSKGEIVDIMPDGKTYEIKIKRNKNGDNEYVKFDKSELKFIGGKGTFYDNGGGVEIAEIPTRERTTITKPTTTPTTTPSKPDKKNPYKPKHIPKPKARK
jgi:hypothetical protein